MDKDEIIIARRRCRNNIPDIFHGAYRKKYDKAMQGHSIRAAIDSKCLECMGWQQLEVKKCDIVTCPLWPYRPYQIKSGAPA